MTWQSRSSSCWLVSPFTLPAPGVAIQGLGAEAQVLLAARSLPTQLSPMQYTAVWLGAVAWGDAVRSAGQGSHLACRRA